MITTQELAALAGVSQSTVSRSLHNSPSISEETRLRVQALAKEHGYVAKRKPHGARGSTQKSAIGIILGPNPSQESLNLYIEYLTDSILQRIEQAGFYTILLTDDGSPEAMERIDTVAKTGSMQGCVIINTDFNALLEQRLVAYGIPHVYTQYFSRPLQKSLNIIDADHFTGGMLATNHLLSLGHRRIATFTSAGSDFEDRTAGYKAALEGSNIPFDPALVIQSGLSHALGYRAAGANWKKLEGCTAFFAQTDLMGLGVLSYLLDSGYTIPGDYSVIGFDGICEGQYCRPQLSTVVQHIDEIAGLSLKRLTRLIQRDDSKATHSFVQPTLLIRGSTAPPHER